MLPARATAVNNSWWIPQQLGEDPEMLSLMIPQSSDPHPPPGSGHTLRSLDQAADPESLYWALRATALYIRRKYIHVEPIRNTQESQQTRVKDPVKTGPRIRIREMKIIMSKTIQSPPHHYSDEESAIEQRPRAPSFGPTLPPPCFRAQLFTLTPPSCPSPVSSPRSSRQQTIMENIF